MPKHLAVEEKEILWKDRKRILGMPISFTSYKVNEERLVIQKGLLHTETDEIMLYRIMDIKLMRKLGQKIFGVGTITLYSSDKTSPKLDLKNIKHSDKVRRFLSNLIEKQRETRRIAGREYLGGGFSENFGEFE